MTKDERETLWQRFRDVLNIVGEIDRGWQEEWLRGATLSLEGAARAKRKQGEQV